MAVFLTALVIFGIYYFINTVASDSPVAAMGLSEIVDAFGKPFQSTQLPNFSIKLAPTPFVPAASAPATP